MQEKYKIQNPPKNEKKKLWERNTLLCVGKLSIEWNREF